MILYDVGDYGRLNSYACNDNARQCEAHWLVQVSLRLSVVRSVPCSVLCFQDITDSYALAGAVFALIMISSAILEVPAGIVSDRIPRVRVVSCGAVASIFAVSSYAVATSVTLLVVGAVLEGLDRSLFSGNNDALLRDSLADHGREDEFYRHYSRVQAAFQIALAISALLGGAIGAWSMRWAVVLSVVPQLLSLFVSLRMREPRIHRIFEPVHPLRHLAHATRLVFRDKKLRRLTFASALGFGAGESAWQLQPAFIAALWPTWAIGIGRGANHLTSIFGLLGAGKVVDRFGSTKALFGGATIAGLIGLVAYGKPTVMSPAITPLEGTTYGVTSTAKAELFQNGSRMRNEQQWVQSASS